MGNAAWNFLAAWYDVTEFRCIYTQEFVILVSFALGASFHNHLSLKHPAKLILLG